MPRFVVLEHDWPTRHWDLLLEAGDVLRAWRLADPPVVGVNRAEPNFDHRRMYLDYEGPVGRDRGTVVRWASGEFDWVTDLIVDVRSSRLTGLLEIQEWPAENADEANADEIG